MHRHAHGTAARAFCRWLRLWADDGSRALSCGFSAGALSANCRGRVRRWRVSRRGGWLLLCRDPRREAVKLGAPQAADCRRRSFHSQDVVEARLVPLLLLERRLRAATK